MGEFAILADSPEHKPFIRSAGVGHHPVSPDFCFGPRSLSGRDMLQPSPEAVALAVWVSNGRS